MPEFSCHPPADDIVKCDENERIRFLIGHKIRMSPLPAEMFDRAREQVSKRTGLPVDEYSTDFQCEHGHPYTEITISADRTVNPERAGIPPAISYFGNAPTSEQGKAYKERYERWRNDGDT